MPPLVDGCGNSPPPGSSMSAKPSMTWSRRTRVSCSDTCRGSRCAVSRTSTHEKRRRSRETVLPSMTASWSIRVTARPKVLRTFVSCARDVQCTAVLDGVHSDASFMPLAELTRPPAAVWRKKRGRDPAQPTSRVAGNGRYGSGLSPVGAPLRLGSLMRFPPLPVVVRLAETTKTRSLGDPPQTK